MPVNLRNRSILILGVTFFAFFIVIAAVSLSVTLSGLQRIEYQDMDHAVNQTRTAMSAESASLLSTAQDWGWWDDMYQYAADRNPEFLDRNTDAEALATIHLNLFMVLDEKGNLLHGKVLSPDFQTSEPVPADLETLLRNNSRMEFLPEDDPGISGIFITPEGPMVVASVPIVRSDRTGPVHGSLIMGRYLEETPLRRINEMTGFTVALDWQGKSLAGTGPVAGPGRLPGETNLIVVADNESIVTGYSTVRDITGRDIIFSVSKDRQLYRIGFSNILTNLFLLAIWGVMTGLVMVFVMDRIVLRRMEVLTDHVRSLSATRDEIPVPVLSGDDELAELERAIITSRKDLQIREQQLRVFVNAMPGPAALFSRDGTILLANPAFGEYLHLPLADVIGADYRSCVPKEEIEKYDRYVGEAFGKKIPVHFEDETNGRTTLMSYYPVLGNDGEVLQLGLLAFDISERKRLENALQRVTKKIALLNTVIFSDIQNKVFVQIGYLELARRTTENPKVSAYLEKEEEVISEIQSSLTFARQFNDMGMSPPRWQSVQDVILFAISHLDLGVLSRDYSLQGLEIYADPLLERVFVTLVENTILHATGATVTRAGYSVDGDVAVISVEDNGPGIEPARKEAIFKKETGAGGSTSLFLSREILSITGITIRENGVPGTGARFEIRVPKGSYRFPGK